MALSFRHLVLFAAAFVSPRVSDAQSGTPEQQVRFTVFCTRPAVGLAYLQGEESPSVPVIFYPTARSPRYQYRGVAPLRFVDVQSRQIVAEAVIPPTMAEALLILVPTEKVEVAEGRGLRYQVFVVDDGASARAAGSFAIINLSGLALTGLLSGNPSELGPGLSSVRLPARSANLELRTRLRNRSYQAYTGSVHLDKSERALLLLLPPVEAGSLEVQARLLKDEPPAEQRRTNG